LREREKNGDLTRINKSNESPKHKEKQEQVNKTNNKLKKSKYGENDSFIYVHEIFLKG